MRKINHQEYQLLYRPFEQNDIVTLCSYSHHNIQALIKENKYHQNQHSAKLLAELITNWLQKENIRNIVLIPIPQSRERAREREHNQIESVLKYVTLPEDARVDTNIMWKSRHTVTQTSLSREQRLVNIRDSFSINDKVQFHTLSGKTIIIVDDVMTTGATLKAARASLAPHLPPTTKIILLALAH